MVCIDFFFPAFSKVVLVANGGRLYNTLNLLATTFSGKVIAQVAYWEGSLSSNNCNLTQTDSNHSQTDWRSAKNCSLIFKHSLH